MATHVENERDTTMTTKLTWLGHAAWLIETGGHTLLVDPYLDDSPTAPLKASAVKPDFILISHGHFDHVGDAATIAIKHEATVIANYEICEWLGKQGVEAHAADEHRRRHRPAVRPGENDDRPSQFDARPTAPAAAPRAASC